MSKLFTYFSLVMVMIIWGANVVAIKLLVNAFTPITITALRLFAASLTVFFMLAVMRQSQRMTVQQIAMIFMVGLCNVVGHHYFLATGLTKTTASNAGIILGMAPLVTALFAVVFFARPAAAGESAWHPFRFYRSRVYRNAQLGENRCRFFRGSLYFFRRVSTGDQLYFY